LEALDAARVPKSRLVGHFSYGQQQEPVGDDNDQLLYSRIDAALEEFCGSVSVRFDVSHDDISENHVLSVIESVQSRNAEVVVQIPKAFMDGYGGGGDDNKLATMVGSVCKAITKQQPKLRGTVSLVDPTPSQLGRSFAASMVTDRDDGLFTTVVCTRSGEALGLVYSSAKSIVASLECGRGVYFSRSRQSLWRKGDTSGHFQTLHRLDVDCDGDALRFTVTQRCGEDDDNAPAFCHLHTLTCWGAPRGIRALEETLQERLRSAPEGSYTKRLFDDSTLLRDKLVEEAQELSEADSRQHVAEELADVLYFAMVKAARSGVSIDDAASELDRRARKVTRRQGDSKAFRIAAGEAILQTSNDDGNGGDDM